MLALTESPMNRSFGDFTPFDWLFVSAGTGDDVGGEGVEHVVGEGGLVVRFVGEEGFKFCCHWWHECSAW